MHLVGSSYICVPRCTIQKRKVFIHTFIHFLFKEIFNSYFIETVEKLADQNRGTLTTYNMTTFKTNTCPQTIFINPVSENEVEKVIKNLKGKHSSGFDDVTDSIVKKCVQFVKTPLADICNASFTSGIFPEMLKIAIVKPSIKRGIQEKFKTTDPFPSYQYSQRL